MDITLKCCVVDDEPLARGLICSFVEKTPFLSLEASFASASEAIKCVLEKKVDLLFLDIQMPELNGIEFAKIIPPECRIIFIIRKTKRFDIPERAVYFLKTKRTAGGTPPPQNIFDRLTPVFT